MHALKQTSLRPRTGGQPGFFRVKVWDLATRCFHWLLVALVLVSFATGNWGGTAMRYHEYSGVAIIVLLLFRLVWGVAGGRESRFTAFVKGPSAVAAYASSLLKKQSARYLGHNPLGGWSVILLLGSLAIQAGSGLFTNDDILTEGPLFSLVSKTTSDSLTRVHLFNKNILAALAAIHVAAIIFYFIYKKENLLLPMLNGKKKWHRDERPFLGKTWLAAIIAALAAMVVYRTIY